MTICQVFIGGFIMIPFSFVQTSHFLTLSEMAALIKFCPTNVCNVCVHTHYFRLLLVHLKGRVDKVGFQKRNKQESLVKVLIIERVFVSSPVSWVCGLTRQQCCYNSYYVNNLCHLSLILKGGLKGFSFLGKFHQKHSGEPPLASHRTETTLPAHLQSASPFHTHTSGLHWWNVYVVTLLHSAE